MSVRPTLGGQQASVSKTVSKVPKILPGLSKENVGQRSAGTCGRAGHHCHGWGLAGSGQPLLLEGVVSFGCQGTPCPQGLLPDISPKEDLNLESLRSKQRWMKSYFSFQFQFQSQGHSIRPYGLCSTPGSSIFGRAVG